MSGWQDPTGQPALVVVNENVVYLLLGIYGWEYIQSLCVEYKVIFGRLPFRSPLIPYIVGRMCLLVHFIFLTVGTSVTSPFSGGNICRVSVLLTCITGDIALGCSSTIFMIRTWVIWKDSHWVHALLLFLTLGLWTVLALVVFSVKSIDINGVCNVYIDHLERNAAVLLYTTCYDLLVFVLSTVGLSRQRSQSPLKKRLHTQGILYFAVVGVAYIPPMVFALLGDTSLMAIFCNCAITASTIVSSRAVRSLLSLDTTAPGQTTENNMALTTQIAIQSTTRICEGVSDERPCVDKAESC